MNYGKLKDWQSLVVIACLMDLTVVLVCWILGQQCDLFMSA
jgi:hypothetical protein